MMSSLTDLVLSSMLRLIFTGGDALLDLGGRESALDIRCCHTTSHHVASV